MALISLTLLAQGRLSNFGRETPKDHSYKQLTESYNWFQREEGL
jgi:hypothetical protein